MTLFLNVITFIHMEKAIATIVIAITSLLALVGLAGLTGDSDYSCNDTTVIVTYGDTLWSIAEAHCTGNLQVAVDDLVDTYSTSLQVGDVITLGKDK